MDRYGYVSNNYHGHAMAGQARAMSGGGGGAGACRCSSHHHHQSMHMQASQAPCGCRHKQNGGAGPVMVQPVSGGSVNGGMLQEGREWTTGKAGCFEHCGSCMAAFCCFWCFECYIASRMDENMCGPMCGSPFMVALRTTLRGANGIEGSVCKDMCAYWFCPCCVVAQMYRELKNTSMI